MVLVVLVGVGVVVLSLDSSEDGAFEAWEANAALAEDEAERSVHVESPGRKRRRTASGGTL